MATSILYKAMALICCLSVLADFGLLTVYQTAYAGDDFYQLLGIARSADNKDIRRAFKKLALIMHPDKNKEKDAHDKFVKINRAYEVLKDSDLRKKYDLHGEEGLKDDFNKPWQFQSWNYYKNQFGIYDDDSEIITLNFADFSSISQSNQIWFINFYSPFCSHCHHLAPTYKSCIANAGYMLLQWRQVAKELEGIIRIGAVNCQDEQRLCNMQQIRSYPSLMLYPNKIQYRGQRQTEDLVQFVLQSIQAQYTVLTQANFLTEMNNNKLPWVINFCPSVIGDNDCLGQSEMLKLSIVMKQLANTARIHCNVETDLCNKLNHSNGIYFYPSRVSQVDDSKKLNSSHSQEIFQEILKLLPEIRKMNETNYQATTDNVMKGKLKPLLVYFMGNKDDDMLELRRLPALLTSRIKTAVVDCSQVGSSCQDLHLSELPKLVLFKKGGYEIHLGRLTVYDAAQFARESATTRVVNLNPQYFQYQVIGGKGMWFVDYFAPWCPPCKMLIPEWRKASKLISSSSVNFGTVDCTIHHELCRQMNIRSYPSTIFYNGSSVNIFSGDRSADNLVDFIEDIIKPSVVSLTPNTFRSLVEKKSTNKIWVIDYFAPWCRPCLHFASDWRKIAKMVDGRVKVAKVDCQMYGELCQSNGIRSYPSIILHPLGTYEKGNPVQYRSRRKTWNSVLVWIHEHLPSLVPHINYSNFYETVIRSSDMWLVDYYAPWCGHCVQFSPIFEKLTSMLKGKAKTAKVNCEVERQLCQKVNIRSYPTIKLYQGNVNSNNHNQWPEGEKISSQNHQEIFRIVLQKLKDQKQSKISHDEL
ncbi:DnaJ-like protein subfamily C member 10 [Trichoplax sp. H2]|nr:DnaJ-like protein subfamily C member 10 [Trichoplax sp. H2]|eukprot:RDD38578.1 DnaJ-like protein subfamily C member 10 [Trichoplax sp. H2]